MDSFLDREFFHLDGQVVFENGFSGNPAFEKSYTSLRKEEGRLYDDDTVAALPRMEASHPLKREWIARERSCEKLIQYLKSRQTSTLVEIGCGNGWLLNTLSKSLTFPLAGLDVNVFELTQAARLFGGSGKIVFICADIFSAHLKASGTDIFVLAGVVQYFPDLQKIIGRLLQLLKRGGEIHIIDSPFYKKNELLPAITRSEIYFPGRNHPEMSANYFHHSWDSFGAIPYRIQSSPKGVLKKIQRRITGQSPFPWIIIPK